jgi:hypothetical protein
MPHSAAVIWADVRLIATVSQRTERSQLGCISMAQIGDLTVPTSA